jgi:ornithine--oxo-acid transaminase
MAKRCFWGRSITSASGCNDPIRREHFGPFTPGFALVDYNDVDAIERYLESDPFCVAVMLEPIQGEAGTIIPTLGYLGKVKAVCEKYNVLLVADEIQVGLGRTGKMMAYEYDMRGAKPDVICLGKALSGGVTPSSGFMADAAVMDVIGPGQHGSTYGGNPLSMAVSLAAVQAIVEEGMVENSFEKG